MTIGVLLVAANCRIESQGYGLVTGAVNEAFVKLNAQRVFFTSSSNNELYRGVNTLFIDPFACNVSKKKHYDTFGSSSDATELKDDLQGLADNSILVVVTCDEPSMHLGRPDSSLLRILQDMGADVSDVQYRGAFTFVAKKGAASMTMLDKVLTETASRSRQPFVHAIVKGKTLDSYITYQLLLWLVKLRGSF